jgi:hypothetical protein
MPPIFGRSKSLRTTAAELADSQPRIQKSKSFKRIRGLLRVGESRRERRARKEGRAVGEDSFAAAGPEPDEASTVMNVDVDDRSVATQSVVNTNPRLLEEQKGDVFPPSSTSGSAATAPSYILKVVLLLMDPETRRFELLQLEFDSHKALVADVLAQIPLSVTEVALRKQVYTGIAGTDGTAMPPQQLLSSFCKGNEVVVAIPDGVTAYECTRLARPILSDDNVVAMVRTFIILGIFLLLHHSLTLRFHMYLHTSWHPVALTPRDGKKTRSARKRRPHLLLPLNRTLPCRRSRSMPPRWPRSVAAAVGASQSFSYWHCLPCCCRSFTFTFRHPSNQAVPLVRGFG